ncbi:MULTISPECIES: sigma E protease regulator RseP [unclassified Colwellia]|uniref:sigma E protease regulator RseP n=1 Tax=unclassified Colwellia TaxID=196834 RepID=UPI0015F3CA9B|nr:MULTISPECIES: sigma E protease regulator RseP [unclassified Colwellia]MBA6231528.1 sigma E protease regulator RseP [Colwellia sp. MB02u-7]MBA6235392.1 sigma E protease regulator RseP [Colwellia sp. MB02u-11]MBA6254651.1 sigma E protease regulator RseP [Colwellia sp. MB3u-28]MBA6259905.1 sigma E protease regulator RseP [Colwellia sp. MB3u-41]MBA6299908.1 sigma E protease regulator RseP [Colwellia sp. MB3u-22]
MFDFFWNLASFVVALGILITVHEYGHYWVARRNGVQVERFSIGFGKVLWRKVNKEGTEFVIALIPLGGYVKMLDGRVDEVQPEDIDKTFNNKTVYQRIAIIAAGPFANFAFAIFAFYLMFLIGVPSVKPIVGEIAAGSIAHKAKINSDSQIVEVAGQKALDWQDVNLALVSQIGETSFTIITKDKGSASSTTHNLDTSVWPFSPDKESAIASLGIAPFRAPIYAELAYIEEGSAADKAGLKVEDKLISINSEAINGSWAMFSSNISQLPEQNVVLIVQRQGVNKEISVTPTLIERSGRKVGYLGVIPKSEPYPKEYLFELRYGVVDALGQSLQRTWNLVVLSFDMIGKLITGDVSVKNLSGPISIAQGAGSSAEYGLVYFLGFLALISINLGIINLLPLPVLDGGHLFYYLVEIVTGKPVPEKIQEIGFKFGTLALLGLMSIALFNDFSRL